MMSLFDAAWVIARRDFIATVYSRSFILFLLVPLVVFGAAFAAGTMAERNELSASQPVVAVIADSATVQALNAARQRLVDGMTERSFPKLQAVQPAENVAVQARRLLADEQGGYSAVFSGTLDQPTLTGPSKVEETVTRRLQLVVDMARRSAALERSGAAPPQVAIQRVVTQQAAGNLQMIRRTIAQTSQTLIFGVTVLLATLLLSNLAEEKSNKVIEVLAAAVPLDAVFLGKLVAMLGISLVGLSLWGGMLGLGYLFFQVLQNWVHLPDAGPAVGWPVFFLLVFLYYAANYMLLGALFLGIGGQASNIREIQTLSMPVTMLQVFVFLLAMSVVGDEGGAMYWTAYILPFSSPLSMVAHAAISPSLWPHLLALAWQVLWIVIVIRASSRLFRATVLKSGPGGAFFSLGTLFRAKAE
ncbi:MAG TPA: ABC transporter permease [Allosphingosinicella sp.]|jgi:ABC-2 type transport system permease protein|nr:ABC transporter permease [Allosphingosinicella sp.]